MEYTVKLTDVQDRALRHAAVDPQLWIQNAVDARAALAVEELVSLEIQRMVNDPKVTSIPASQDEIVLNATTPDAAAREKAVVAAMNAELADGA